ncbi:hypothetical protein BGZ94_001759 [Podila epigama]|nr:hypothetical protein BGZ94_001759 [Podila epigama]
MRTTGFIATLVLAALSVVKAAPVQEHDLAMMDMEKRSIGVNNWNCKLNPQHPVPLVLVHSTFPTSNINWIYHGTRFQMKGYCAFQLDYGLVPQLPLIGGMDWIEKSALQLKVFIDKVLAATNSTKVDLLGHSQGGLMPIYYLKRLGGADKVRKFGALAPATHGTDGSGLAQLTRTIGIYDILYKTVSKFCYSCTQMLFDSKFLKDLYADGGDTVPGVEYLFLATKYDQVITPYTRAFLKGVNPLVQNKLIQDYCPFDITMHAGMFMNPLAFNIMDNFFSPGPRARRLNCFTYLLK